MSNFIQFSYFAKNKIENLYYDSLIKPQQGYLNINHIIIIFDILSERIKVTRIEYSKCESSRKCEYRFIS